MTHNCRECGRLLVVGENISQNMIDTSSYWCRDCRREYNRSWAKANPDKAKAKWTRQSRKRGHLPMSENKSCSSFLGDITERLLPHIFGNVKRMPYGNPGYDYICNKGYKVDVKSSCRYHLANGTDFWQFTIRRNNEAHYFFCIAIDDRDGLNPEHVWLIPGDVVNHLKGVTISETTLHKWSEYELTDKLDGIIACCNDMKNENGNEQ